MLIRKILRGEEAKMPSLLDVLDMLCNVFIRAYLDCKYTNCCLIESYVQTIYKIVNFLLSKASLRFAIVIYTSPIQTTSQPDFFRKNSGSGVGP